jgi:hypothetical protein
MDGGWPLHFTGPVLSSCINPEEEWKLLYVLHIYCTIKGVRLLVLKVNYKVKEKDRD